MDFGTIAVLSISSYKYCLVLYIIPLLCRRSPVILSCELW